MKRRIADDEMLIASHPIRFPTEFKVCEFKTYMSERGREIRIDRAEVAETFKRDNVEHAEGRRARYLFGYMDQLQAGDHAGCGHLETRDDGVWAVDCTWHNDSHLAFAWMSPLAIYEKKTSRLDIRGVAFSNSKDAESMGIPRTPWSLDPYGQAAVDFGIAYNDLRALVLGFPETAERPYTMKAMAEFQERVNTFVTTMKINTEITEGLRAAGFQ